MTRLYLPVECAHATSTKVTFSTAALEPLTPQAHTGRFELVLVDRGVITATVPRTLARLRDVELAVVGCSPGRPSGRPGRPGH
jgi:hypothetical protein